MSAEPMQGARPVPLLISIFVGLAIWMAPHPAALTDQTWHLFAIFVATIVGIIVRPLQVGPVVLLGMVACAMTNTLTASQVFSAFGKYQIWLIPIAFFIAHGLIKTGLAERVSYHFLRFLGKKTIGIAYGMLGGELVMAPFIPSLAARSGGIVYPVIMALAHNFEEVYPGKKLDRLKGFLTITAFQGAVIASGMFLTAMAANPIAVDAAAMEGIEITWTTWAVAASVPGLVSLAFIPWFVFKLMKPEVTETPNAPELARKKLQEMGSMSRPEWTMLLTLLFVLVLWVLGPWIGVNSTIAALLGLGILMITGVLSWQDCLEQTKAWDALFWLAGIVAMGTHLKQFGFFSWLSGEMGGVVAGMSWQGGFLVLVLVYFYTHYLFASNTAHVSSMYAAFLTAALAIGTPGALAALVLAFFSNLFGGLTHYSSGPAPIFYGARFVSLRRWWGVGLACSVVNILIWLTVGSAWWRLLGLW